MPIFRAQVNYRFGTSGRWSNVWHIDAASLSAAATALNSAGVPVLVDILHPSATLVSLLVSDPDTNAFITTPVNLAGTSTAGDELLPLYNSMKVLFPSPTFGRPDYKYIKGFVTEGIQNNGLLQAGTITAVEGIVDTLISDMADASAPLVSINGELYASNTVQQAVQMRQMHRKRRRVVVTP